MLLPMPIKQQNKIISIVLIFSIAALVFLADSNDVFAAKKSRKSAKKSKSSYETLVKKRKTERLKTLYQYFPVYEEWERADVYPYNDALFLDGFDKTSVYENFATRKLLVERINDWLGVRYRLPGRSRKGVDCSNFTSIITKEVLGISIPAGAANQATLFRRIDKLEDLQFGDMMFFTGRNKASKRIGHVGIYIGNGLFAHSATNHGVIYTHISDGYYTKRYRFGGRITKTDIALKL
jgi:cell wall-associated NlpC family hydrolase